MSRKWIHLIGIILVAGVWIGLVESNLAGLDYFWIAVLGTIAVIPLVLVGRSLLDREPTLEQAERVTSWMHYLLALFLGSATIAATRLGNFLPDLSLPVPAWVGIAVMFVSSIVLLLVVANLALKGMGAPFALALTRLLAVEWFYAWTRNPQVLAGIALLVGVGLYLQSGLFLLWLLVLVIPMALLFVSVFEERELEIRFGQEYLEYKAQTPGFIPKKPR
jgi:protein-S-isoprenylcysteine O-methyltransferase Ste14